MTVYFGSGACPTCGQKISPTGLHTEWCQAVREAHHDADVRAVAIGNGRSRHKAYRVRSR